MEAWIEIKKGRIDRELMQSPPSWRRGLKCGCASWVGSAVRRLLHGGVD